MKRVLFFSLFAMFLCCTVFSQEVKDKAFDTLIDSLLSHSVDEIGVGELHSNLSTYTLLDAREKREYNVSHLPKSTWVGYTNFSAQRVKHLDRNTPIVVYCSIGVRSEHIATEMTNLGFKEVYNLYGGIFEWSNQSFPLENKHQETTQKVHAYDKTWGVWLDGENKVYD